MAHWSEDANKLELRTTKIKRLSQIENIKRDAPDLYLFWFPSGRTNSDAKVSKEQFAKFAKYCEQLDEGSTACILTTPADAALLMSYLQPGLKFQHWMVIKTRSDVYPTPLGNLPTRHVALLVLTRYKKYLRHTKTRVQYTYCPTCGKTTKDYGGKKHMHHQYGTLLSDVWRDIECDPRRNIDTVVDRLRDLFGLAPYNNIHLIDLRSCKELLPAKCLESVNSPVVLKKQSTNGLLPINQLIKDDCLKALPLLPDNSVDFCFADLPYNLNKKYYRSNDSLESDKYFEWCNKWLGELCRVLKPGRTLAVLNIPEWSVRHYQQLCSSMTFQSWIVWDALSFPTRNIMPTHYSITCFSKGSPRPLPGLSAENSDSANNEYLKILGERYCIRKTCKSKRRKQKITDHISINDLWPDIHRLKHNSQRVDHPCQLPPLLMRRLFTLFTNTGEIILDCFNGAGTSTLVAQQMDRRFIGIELSARYHKIASRRHAMLTLGKDPFGKVNSIPRAKNSPVQRLPKKKYEVTKKDLQLDVKRIAQHLDRLPTREDVQLLSKFPFEYFDDYFISWGEVCAAARTTGMLDTPMQFGAALSTRVKIGIDTDTHHGD